MKGTDECKWRCKPSHMENEESLWTGKRALVLCRFASACTGGVSQNRAGWESYRTVSAGDLASITHHSPAAATFITPQQLPPSKGRLLQSWTCHSYGECNGLCFRWGTSCKQNSSCLTLPCVRSLFWWDRTEDELQQFESQMGSRIFGGAQSMELQQDRWRLKLGMRVSHSCCYSGTTTLPNSNPDVSWVVGSQQKAEDWLSGAGRGLGSHH